MKAPGAAVKLKRRSCFGMLLHTPRVFKAHYNILRDGGNSRLRATKVALSLTFTLYNIKRDDTYKREIGIH